MNLYGGDYISVPTGERGESPVQFVATADEIEIYTIQRCAKFPQEYREYILKDIAHLASAAASNVLAGNSIYPVKPKGGDLTRYIEDVKRRRNYFKKALEYYKVLGNKVSKLYKIKKPTRKHRNQRKKWAQLIGSEIKLLQGVLESDQKRYRI